MKRIMMLSAAVLIPAATMAWQETIGTPAQTVRQGSVLKFANPAYQRKDNVWKACYRAGRAPAAAALEFAKAWLKEL